MGPLFARFIQILVCVSLLAIIAAAILIFAKTMAQRGGKRVILKFLLVELLLMLCTGGVLLLFVNHSFKIGGLIFASMGITLLANLPVAIMAKLFQVIFLKKDNGSRQPST